jgi:spore coat protein U-like protein
MKRNLLPSLVLLFLAFCLSDRPEADATQTGAPASLGVGAAIDVQCSLITSSLLFGSYVPTNPSPHDVAANITLDCQNGGGNVVLAIQINQGVQPAPGSTANNPIRRMSNGTGGRLRYNVYRDAARTQVWGDTLTSAFYPGNGPFPMTIPMYGRIPASQLQAAGSYTDMLTATVYF